MLSPFAVADSPRTLDVVPNPAWLVALLQDDPLLWSDWLDTFPDLNTTDDQGRTPLHWACLLQRSRMAHELLLLSADPWTPDRHGRFAWDLAMQRRADASWAWDQWPQRYPMAFAQRPPHDAWRAVCVAQALLQAARTGRLDMVAALTAATDVRTCPGLPLAPCDRTTTGTWQFLPWAHAVVMLDLVVAFPLLKAWGIRLDDVDQDGRTAVQWGIALQRPDLVDLLLHAGATLTTGGSYDLHLIDEQATRPDPVNLAMVLSPSMAHWIGNHLNRLAPDTSPGTDLWDLADDIHGSAAMAMAMFACWKNQCLGLPPFYNGAL